ncbi:hypothetical protein ABK040_013017 [Willaertia magna]
MYTTSDTDFDYYITNENLLRGVYAYGLERPYPIQLKFIKTIVNTCNDNIINEDRDVNTNDENKEDFKPSKLSSSYIVASKIGSGKTIAFILGVLLKINLKETTKLQAILLLPNIELAHQTYNVITCLTEYFQNINIKLFLPNLPPTFSFEIGQIIVTTISALQNELSKNNTLKELLKDLKILVIDEMDVVLQWSTLSLLNNTVDNSLRKDLKSIIKIIPKECELFCFGKLFPPKECLQFDERLMTAQYLSDRNDDFILENYYNNNDNSYRYNYNMKYEVLYEHTQQSYYYCKTFSKKIKRLRKLMDSFDFFRTTIIFCNTIESVEILYKELQNYYECAFIHKELSGDHIHETIMNVRRGLCTKLITTDEEFRGIDIHHIGLIIHFDVSQQLEVCLFRSGRCSRNRSGQAIYLPSTLEELEFCVEMLDGKTHYACYVVMYTDQ